MRTEPSSRSCISTVNPATNVLIARYEPFDQTDMARAVADAGAAQQDWSTRTYDERAKAVTAAAEILREHRGELARFITPRRWASPWPSL